MCNWRIIIYTASLPNKELIKWKYGETAVLQLGQCNRYLPIDTGFGCDLWVYPNGHCERELPSAPGAGALVNSLGLSLLSLNFIIHLIVFHIGT